MDLEKGHIDALSYKQEICRELNLGTDLLSWIFITLFVEQWGHTALYQIVGYRDSDTLNLTLLVFSELKIEFLWQAELIVDDALDHKKI